MMFFRKKPVELKIAAITTPKPVRGTVDIVVKKASKPDSDGRLRRMHRTVEDNRLL